ncbi:hypothetical protein WICPIJ_004239 [Wickerhamomyces pijperi]|uniref:AB hydrolase-1 domain-containing protein n=1 Tax=Wickerhamomyces pijperi TaxID=599730 RepID=A0A9P8Q8A1_WICPI|nr:hypothetical protein WICPIJ_004239 [Wickerhamomyces pijperi]
MTSTTASTSTPPDFEVRNDYKKNYTFRESFKHWWNRSNLEQSENEVLSLLPFYPNGDSKRTAQTIDVPIDTDKNFIHEFNVKNIQIRDKSEDQQDHIVLIHGYGAALGFFYKNFEALTEKPGTNLHALDLLGYGLSSRPNLPHFNGNSMNDVVTVENFFVESVESWRKKKNIDKFYLIGHSLGGYLSSLYALKYPEHVRKLVLISPVGVETSVYDLSSTGNDQGSERLEGPDIEREVGAHYKDTDSVAEPSLKKSSSLHVPDANGYVSRIPNLPSYLKFVWDRNLSPFSLVRFMGPWGPSITSRWSFNRFGKTEGFENTMKLHIYSYNTFVARGSGEYALTRLLAPGALARYPLLSRLPKNLKVDTLWLYGDNDWMSKEAGLTIVEQINKENSTIVGGVTADYEIISSAGHHIYLDNPIDFKNSVYKFFDW